MNTWLIAGVVAGTGVLTEMAAHAFPGRTIKLSAEATAQLGAAPAASSTRRARHHHRGLTPPARAPQTHPQVQEPAPVVSGGS
jgi:hypothetical protein